MADTQMSFSQKWKGCQKIPSFQVCDSLLNIGPCGHISMGEPAFLSEEFSQAKKADPDVELVTTSGYGKNGALCVLQQSVRPQVKSTKSIRYSPRTCFSLGYAAPSKQGAQ
jgi:hypothetical protein